MPAAVAAYSGAVGMVTVYTKSGEVGVDFRQELTMRRSEGENLTLILDQGSLQESSAEGPVTCSNGCLPGKMIEQLQPSKHHAFCPGESPQTKKNADHKIEQWL